MQHSYFTNMYILLNIFLFVFFMSIQGMRKDNDLKIHLTLVSNCIIYNPSEKQTLDLKSWGMIDNTKELRHTKVNFSNLEININKKIIEKNTFPTYIPDEFYKNPPYQIKLLVDKETGQFVALDKFQSNKHTWITAQVTSDYKAKYKYAYNENKQNIPFIKKIIFYSIFISLFYCIYKYIKS